MFFRSADLNVSLRGGTAGEGPLEVGIASPDLTVTEVEEALEAQPTSQYDVPAIEHARRPVKTIGILPGLATNETLNDGKSIRVRLPMMLPAGKNIPQVWVMNRSGGALTGNQIIAIKAKYYGNWK